MLFHPAFSHISSPCHYALLLVKPDIPVTDLNSLKPLPSVTLWAVVFNGFRLVHTDADTATLPDFSSLHISTTILNDEVDFTITVSPYVSGSGHLVGLDGGCFTYYIFKLTTVCLKVCEPPIATISDPKGSVISGNEVLSTPARLV